MLPIFGVLIHPLFMPATALKKAIMLVNDKIMPITNDEKNSLKKSAVLFDPKN